MRFPRIVTLMAIACLALCWLSASSTPAAAQATYDCAAATGLPQAECEALVTLYNVTDGANWNNNTNWLVSATPCDWYGVSCYEGHVFGVDLGDNALIGTIPPEMGEFSALTYLSLHDNRLSGAIPPELGKLSSLLTLRLDKNQLRGSIPPELGDLTGLWQLLLGNNQLSGSIPPELGNLTSLDTLILRSNLFAGPFPNTFSSLTNLEYLYYQETALCVPSTRSMKTWLETIITVDGTNYICEQMPGSIGGTVTSPHGQPLAGIQVDLYRRLASGAFRHMTKVYTDESGSYRFYNLQNGIKYTLQYFDPNHAYAMEFFGGAPTMEQATLLTASTGMWRNDIDAALEPYSAPAHLVYLPVVDRSPSPVPWSLMPFDARTVDHYGHSPFYGKTPEIIVSSDGSALDVLAQDYDTSTPYKAALLHIEPDGNGYVVTQALTDIPMLDRVVGLDTDVAGNRYFATAVDEANEINSEYPPLDTYRSDIVRVVKLNPAGDVLFNVDLDIVRHASDNKAEMIINPMLASTGRLVVCGDEVGLVHGINTDPDWNINGRRHQKALSTRLSGTTGLVHSTSSIWVSHSFDQRLLCDGEGIVEYQLGDAHPRSIAFGRDNSLYSLFEIKGEAGQNYTFTILGNPALIENDPQYGYIALFATETSGVVPSGVYRLTDPRNLAIVRINDSDNSIDPNLPDTLAIEGTPITNRLRWLTHYTDESNLHAERPKLVGIGGDRYVVLWEVWLYVDEPPKTFQGVYAMVINDEGNTLQPAKLITDKHQLNRGDDAFFLDKRAAWMTGNPSSKTLQIHFVDSALNYRMVTVK